VEREVAVPAGDCSALTWDGRQFWVCDGGRGQALRVQAGGGAADRQVDLPDGVTGLAWAGDGLVAVRADPNCLYRIDAESGQVRSEDALEFWGDAHGVTRVGERLAVGNLHCGGVHFVEDDGQATPHPHMLGGSWVADLAGAGDTIWHLDGFAPAIVHSGLTEHHQILEWGDRPFCEHTTGIAWDGADLWVLDNQSHRLCAVSRRAAA
jgi:hypothetical protein